VSTTGELHGERGGAYIEHVEETHDGTEGRYAGGLGLDTGEGRLDVGGERDISSSPTERDRDKRCGHLPGLHGAVRLWVVERKIPNDEKEECIQADKWNGPVEILNISTGCRGRNSARRDSRWDCVGGKENGHGTAQLSEVGATDEDLLEGRILEDRLGKDVGNIVLQVTMTEERKCVTGYEPAEFAASQYKTTTHPGGTSKVDKTPCSAKDWRYRHRRQSICCGRGGLVLRTSRDNQ